MKYVILHRITTVNRVPTQNTSTISTVLGKFIFVIGTKRVFDYGRYIFYQVMKLTTSTTVKLPICFPSLICGIVLNQHTRILLPIDRVNKRASSMSLHHKLFGRSHDQDIVVANLEAHVPKTARREIISLSKETCRELEDTIRTDTSRKDKLKDLIKALMEESEKEAEAVDGEGNNASDTYDASDKNSSNDDATSTGE